MWERVAAEGSCKPVAETAESGALWAAGGALGDDAGCPCVTAAVDGGEWTVPGFRRGNTPENLKNWKSEKLTP